MIDRVLSAAIGKLAAIPLPRFIALPINSIYCRAYKVDLSEAERPLDSFNCIADFFVRNLKPGVRPIGEGLVSPCDGTLREHGEITGLSLPQVKGLTYRIDEVLGGGDLPRQFQGGWYWNLYLSPRDYHQVHSPVSGVITQLRYLGNRKYPVNDRSWGAVPNLFAVNERAVAVIETSLGPVALVMIAALNVGGIALQAFAASGDQLVSKRMKQGESFDMRHQLAAGDRFGAFHFGSSVLLLASAEFRSRVIIDERGFSSAVRYGESFARERRD